MSKNIWEVAVVAWALWFVCSGNWAKIAQQQASTVFADTEESKDEARQRVEEMLKSFDFMMEMESSAGQKQDDTSKSTVKIEVHLQGLQGWQKLSSFVLDLDSDKPSEPVEIKSEPDQHIVHGSRNRLCPPVLVGKDGLRVDVAKADSKDSSTNNSNNYNGSLALPTEGKLVAKYAGKTYYVSSNK